MIAEGGGLLCRPSPASSPTPYGKVTLHATAMIGYVAAPKPSDRPLGTDAKLIT